MADVTLYDSTGQSSNGASSGASQGGFEAFSFSTGASSGTLADVQVDLRIQSPDTGSITAYLYSSNNSGTTPVPDTALATLGTISDSSLSPATVTLSDFGGASSVTLAPNTRYWIKLVSTSDSQIEYENAAGDGGTGVATEYQMGSGSPPTSSDSNASDGTSVQGLVTEATCFVSGTLIRTTLGNICVDKLQDGNAAVTACGEARPIRWIGHRTIDCRNHPRPHGLMPVRISAHAFGENRPSRDLFVSPGHAICVDVLGEVLIPAIALVNGSTIQQVEVEEVTYWHVELDSHDVILAENLPAESYLDMGNRGFFREANVVDLAAGPDANSSQRTHADFCRPFHGGGPLVDVVRAQLQKRAEAVGWSLTSGLDLHLEIDGERVDPVLRGLTARFQVPADAGEVWLVSPTARPYDTIGTGDSRNLGLCIGALRIDDGFDVRDIAIDDPLLCVGFHAVEEGVRRWTAGRARLPAALWKGCEDSFNLRVELAGMPVPRWMAPAKEAVSVERPQLAILA